MNDIAPPNSRVPRASLRANAGARNCLLAALLVAPLSSSLGCAASAQGEMRIGPDGTVVVSGKLGVSPSGKVRLTLVDDVVEYQGGEINFAHNDYSVSTEATTEETLGMMQKLLERVPELKLRIEGHTDSTGKKSANQQISDARAVAVRDWLVERGIESERIEARGYGESQPAVPEPEPCLDAIPRKLSPEELAKCEPIWAANRRAVFRIVEGLDAARAAMIASGSAGEAAQRRQTR